MGFGQGLRQEHCEYYINANQHNAAHQFIPGNQRVLRKPGTAAQLPPLKELSFVYKSPCDVVLKICFQKANYDKNNVSPFRSPLKCHFLGDAFLDLAFLNQEPARWSPRESCSSLMLVTVYNYIYLCVYLISVCPTRWSVLWGQKQNFFRPQLCVPSAWHHVQHEMWSLSRGGTQWNSHIFQTR